MMSFANIMLDADGLIRQWNARAQRLFGFRNDEIIGKHFSDLYQASESAGSGGLLNTAREVGYVDHLGDCVRDDGSSFPAQALITALWEHGKLHGFSFVVQNTSERSQAQQQRREDDARLNGIIQSAMDAIITVDEGQRVVLFNTAAERIFRCSAADAIGSPLDQFIPQRFRSAHHGHVERFSATGVTMRRMGDQTVLYGLRTDGVEFPIEASISQVTVMGKRLFTVILRDITERQRAALEVEQSNRQLRELYESMHEVREAERTRIARELHDELAQWLTALKMDISWLAARLPPEQPLIDRTEKMKGVVDTTVTAVRRIASDLRPAMIDDLGLAAAIEWLLHEFSQRTGLVVSQQVDTRRLELKDPIATAVYRMLQEALTNVARHAEATEVHISFGVESGNLTLRVRDNGKGFGRRYGRRSRHPRGILIPVRIAPHDQSPVGG
jgi:two-component system sensor histidine kinase UhpB